MKIYTKCDVSDALATIRINYVLATRYNQICKILQEITYIYTFTFTFKQKKKILKTCYKLIKKFKYL